MRRVHLVYPHAPVISAPDAIGLKLAAQLEKHYRVIPHDWDVNAKISPQEGDVLLGHAHPAPWTVFRRSLRAEGWARKLMMQPYHHGDAIQMAWADSVVRRSDLFMAITGSYWFDSVESSVFSHWRPKMVHLDLAIDRRDFPVLKESFNPPGKRRFLYIGGTHWGKNTAYLTALARAGGHAISWIGEGDHAIEGVRPYGRMDLSTTTGRAVVAEHDFLLTVGRADANPATILEAMAWGLIPVCSPESGYAQELGVVNVPVDDVAAASEILDSMQRRDGAELALMREGNFERLESRHTWAGFAEKVVAAIESPASPRIESPGPNRRARLIAATMRSPYAFYRPAQLRKLAKRG